MSEKKIIVDEDWKTQVAAEKEQLERETASKPAPGEVAAATGEPVGDPDPQLPPASFEMLITTFITEAMAGLGQLPHPLTGKPEPDFAHARYAIDMLEVIAEKTQGNLTQDEERALSEMLHQLRMAFIATQAAVPQAAPADTRG